MTMRPFNANIIPSSSPAFGTPIHPIRASHDAPIPSILPIDLPPTLLRPIAFRILTKKYGVTITSLALLKLAVFIGRNCGSKWRDGLAEAVLNFVAQRCKESGRVILDAPEDQEFLEKLCKELGPRMKGGRISVELTVNTAKEGRGKGSAAEPVSKDPRAYLTVVGARKQPRLAYNVNKKHFERITAKPSLLASPGSKTQVFRNRYNIIHQRLLRNESFQIPTTERVPLLRRDSSSLITAQQSYRLTPIANLLGRNGSTHLLLGLLAIAPNGTLAINDLTGSIALDLTRARVVPEDGAWFAPGMIVLVDGIYEEEDSAFSGGLGGGGGIGGTIGGKFIGFTVGGPPCERRQTTLGLTGSNDKGDITAGGGFGWVDFLGVGSEKEKGENMREIASKVLGPSLPESQAETQEDSQPYSANPDTNRGRIVILGELNLDQPRTLQALSKVLSVYASEPASSTPMTFVLIGNFASHAVMSRGHAGSIEYKELFDALAATLSNHPDLLAHCTFIFVPGDHDAWGSSFSGGAAGLLPYDPVPGLFTNRIKKAFTTANDEARKEGNAGEVDGEAIWTSNPSRLCLFGPTTEVVLFRDDISSRLRRTAIRTATGPPPDPSSPEPEPINLDPSPDDGEFQLPAEEPKPLPTSSHTARKLVKTVLDQGYLSPFRLSDRPVLWDFASALQLYPLPSALVLCDAEAEAFVVTYEGCVVLNPGALVGERRWVARWVEWDIGAGGGGRVREVGY